MLSKGMRSGTPTVCRRTLELKQRIRESAARGAASARTRRILLAEPGPPTWPERVLRDSLLEPVDKMVWIALRQSAIRRRFPTYAQIGQAANVSSKSTVSRAIAILRTTRWLARCGTPGMPEASPGTREARRGTSPDLRRRTSLDVRRRTNPHASRGAFREAEPVANRGKSMVVYALHDAPMPVPDTLYLDAGYLTFLQFAQAHPHARVRKIVKEILASLEENVDAEIRRASNMR